jgi:integrase
MFRHVTFKLVLRKDRPNKTGQLPVYLRITENRKPRYYSSGIFVKDKDWLDEKQRVSRKHPDADFVNDRLNEFFHIQRSLFLNQIKEVEEPEIPDFFSYAEKIMERLKANKQYEEWKKYRVVIGKFRDFTDTDYLPFDEITVGTLVDFETYLRTVKKNGRNTIYKNTSKIRRIFRIAIQEEIIPPSVNPFTRYSPKSERPSEKTKLAIADIKRIQDLDLSPGSWKWHSRNYFLFSFYCAGIRFGDLCLLKWNNIHNGRLVYQMTKTGHGKNVKLLPPALEILQHYEDDRDPESYIFPLLPANKDLSDPFDLKKAISSKNVLVNKFLQAIGRLAEIQEHITFHVSRHSFADYARKKNMNLYSISKALGHSDLKITQQYLKSFDEETLDEDMDKLFNGEDV